MSGTSVVDTGVLIGLMEADDPHHAAAESALRNAEDDRRRLLLAASSYAELLVHPIRAGEDAVAEVDAMLRRARIELVPVDAPVARHAAALRARHGSRLRLPDALVVGVARHVGADEVLTTDGRWPEVGLPVTVLAP